MLKNGSTAALQQISLARNRTVEFTDKPKNNLTCGILAST
jgi:hypothetical protein